MYLPFLHQGTPTSTRCLLLISAFSCISKNVGTMLPFIPPQLFNRTPTTYSTKSISLSCLWSPYLQVCLSHHMHLLDCITSCLSHYLPVCIFVCPPVSAPLFRSQPDIIFFKGKIQKAKSILLCVWFLSATLQYNSIYYPHGMCYVSTFSLLPTSAFILLSPCPHMCCQADWKASLRAAVCLPKLTVPKDKGPLGHTGLPGLLLSSQSPSHPKCVQFALESWLKLPQNMLLFLILSVPSS